MGGTTRDSKWSAESPLERSVFYLRCFYIVYTATRTLLTHFDLILILI